jgi:hypothetical protein
LGSGRPKPSLKIKEDNMQQQGSNLEEEAARKKRKSTIATADGDATDVSPL